MTEEDIIRMAREAGVLSGFEGEPDNLVRFAELISAAEAEKYKWDIHSCGPTCGRYVCVARRKAVDAEREACAKLVESGDEVLAQAIRARGEK